MQHTNKKDAGKNVMIPWSQHIWTRNYQYIIVLQILYRISITLVLLYYYLLTIASVVILFAQYKTGVSSFVIVWKQFKSVFSFLVVLPTCQVRVSRFYPCIPSSCELQTAPWALPDLNDRQMSDRMPDRMSEFISGKMPNRRPDGM